MSETLVEAMFKELRKAEADAAATTPAMWADNFQSSRRVTWYRRATFRLDHRWRLIRRHVRRGGRVLDAGCGAGEWVAFLNEMGFLAEGMDYSPQLIERVRRMYPQHLWETGTVQDLSYPDGTFDAVISWGVIEHDEQGPARALAEFKRVLKRGGILIVTVPVDTPRQRRASRLQFPAAADAQLAFFQYFLTPDELSAFVRKAGFTVLAVGLQRAPAVALLWPELSMCVGLSTRHRLNRLVRALFWWHRGIMNMTYCIGRHDSGS